jgi:diguanylate cyclase (GGDEF)-like protein/PAS domain S-box-containing protein
VKPENALITEATSDQITALIATLIQTEQRLEELTAGEVDSVTDRDGRSLLLRHAQEHLRQHDAAGRALFEEMASSIEDVFFMRDALTGQLLYVSPAYERVWGRSCASLYTNPLGWMDAIHPDDLAVSLELRKPGMSATNFVFKYRIVRPDGAIRWIEARGFPILDEAGKTVRMAGVARDITEPKKVATELLESERRFSSTMQNMDMAFVMLDKTGRITHCNDFLLRLTGWERKEVIGQDWFDMFVPPPVERLRTEFAAIFAQQKVDPWRRENEIFTRSGEHRVLRWSNSVLRDESGAIIATASIGEDVTEQRRAVSALRESEQNLRSIVDGALDGILVTDITTGLFVSANPAICKMLGYTREELLHMGIPQIIPGADLTVAQMHNEKLIRGEPKMSASVRLLRKEGTLVYADIKGTAIVQNGNACLLGVFRDITDRNRADKRINYLNRIYAVLSGINSMIVRARDRDEMFRDACEVAVKHGGFRVAMITLTDPVGGDFLPVASAGEDEVLLGTIRRAIQLAAPVVNALIRDKKIVVANDSANDSRVLFGKEYAAAGVHSLAVLPLILADTVVGALGLYAEEPGFFLDGEMKLLSGLAADVAFGIDHFDKESRLTYLAYYDELTGLANRTLFLERVALHMHSATASGQKLALFLMDIERFRYVNESLGREAGDQLLKQVAGWMTRSSENPNLLARLDADHFAFVVPDAGNLEKLRQQIENKTAAFMEHPFRLDDTTLRMAVKLGVAIFPDDADNVETLFRNAEAALKKAKSSNSPYLLYAHSMNEAVSAKLALENRLRDAFDKDQFELYYQPKVSLASGKITGVEALIRWNDPERGQVLPGLFIPILEETGLIYKVGGWALRTAIADYLRWCAAGLPAVRIAVNVSALQLRNAGFIDEVKQALSVDPHAAEGLELEITESLIMENVKSSIDNLKAIRALNVSIAIDDFGTGFSSLSYLARLPVDTLKIDRSFVVDMMMGPEGLALVSTIINLAHSLKLDVVAEGVETDEQARLLRLLGCDEMQGYLFSKPLPVDLFEQSFLVPPISPAT